MVYIHPFKLEGSGGQNRVCNNNKTRGLIQPHSEVQNIDNGKHLRQSLITKSLKNKETPSL